jgi:hypothetical protein
VRQRFAGPTLDVAVGRVRHHCSNDRSGGFSSELSAVAALRVIVKYIGKRTASGSLHFLVCGVCAHGRNDGLASATVERTPAVARRLQDVTKRSTYSQHVAVACHHETRGALQRPP